LDYKRRIALCYDSLASDYDLAIGPTTKGTIGDLFRDVESLIDPTVLEIGCGTGSATLELIQKLKAKGNFFGIDASKEMVNIARSKAQKLGFINVTFKVMDAEKLDFPKCNFDFVFSNQVFHWITNKKAMLKGVYDCLKPEGKIAFVFQGGSSFRELFVAYQKTRRKFPELDLLDQPRSLTKEKTEKLLREARFEEINVFSVKRAHYINPLLFLAEDNLTITPWKFGLAPGKVAMLQKQVINELIRIKPENTLRTEIETIYCYGTKK
jgi:ubiquinone/menaquinone biosynthesis C-methylase UbiE